MNLQWEDDEGGDASRLKSDPSLSNRMDLDKYDVSFEIDLF